MAKVIGPLFSQEASGQIGKSIVFGQRRGQAVVRRYTTPSNPQTPNQIAVRIRLAVTGRVTRRINVGAWSYSTETDTFIENLREGLRIGEVWNSQAVRLMQGPNNSFYDARVTQYAALDVAERDAWQAEAVGAIGGLEDYTRGDVTITAGFALFVAQAMMGERNYGTFTPTVPQTLTTG